MVQGKFGGFLHSICETNLRFFHVPVPRPKQAPTDGYRTAGLQSLTLWAQQPTILHTMQTFIGYSPVFTGIVQKVPEISLSGTFLLFLMSSQKHLLSL